MNFGEDDTTITTLVETRACLCGHQYRHHGGEGCAVCSCDRFCSALHPSFFENDQDTLKDLS